MAVLLVLFVYHKANAAAKDTKNDVIIYVPPPAQVSSNARFFSLSRHLLVFGLVKHWTLALDARRKNSHLKTPTLKRLFPRNRSPHTCKQPAVVSLPPRFLASV